MARTFVVIPCLLVAYLSPCEVLAEDTPQAIHAARRARLLDSLGDGALLVMETRPSESRPSGSSPGDKDFFYLTGVRGQRAVLAAYRKLDASRGELLFLAEPNPMTARWDGALLVPGDDARISTGLETLPMGDLDPTLSDLVAQARTIYSANAADRIAQLARDAANVTIDDPTARIHALRQVKDEAEIRLLQRAIDLTGAGIIEAMRSAEPGMFEFELQAAAEYLWRRGGAQREGFDSILGSGPNSCILHYRANRRRTESGDLVVMDVGAEFEGYTGDVTRTFPVSGKFTDRQREIYELVLDAQKAGIELCRPGRTMHEVHAAAASVLARAGMAEHFWHGTSHWLGLDVHDVGDTGRPLEPGMVLTVEPGIYLPEESLGVRIEDDVLVTASGDPQVLSRWIPSDPDEVEAWMAKDGIGNLRREYEPAAGK